MVIGASIEEEEAADSLSSAPPAVVTPQPGLASNAATEEVTSRLGLPVSFEPSNDSGKPDGALPAELHELAGEAPQPDPPPSAPEPTVESDVLDTTVGMPFGCLQSMNAVKQIRQIRQI